MITSNNGLKTVDLYIDGMHCERCLQNVRQSLSQVKGVESYSVDIGHARVDYLPQLAGLEEIRRAVEKAGYTAHYQAPRRNLWQRFLFRMIRSNESLFGSKQPDCCTIVRDQEARRSH
jgi:copper chaperone CopZ